MQSPETGETPDDGTGRISLAALQVAIDRFVATTLETLSATGALIDAAREGPDPGTRIDQALAQIDLLEELMARVRAQATESNKEDNEAE